MVMYSEGTLLTREVSTLSTIGPMNRLIRFGYLLIDIFLEGKHLELKTLTDLQIPIPT